jgi:glycine dehydrogenase
MVSMSLLMFQVYRLALQTREQHIRREKATSNICTAQALLANIAAMYAVYHGPQGLYNIAFKVHSNTIVLARALKRLGVEVGNKHFFDTLTVKVACGSKKVVEIAEARGVNFRIVGESGVGVSLDETVSREDIVNIVEIFVEAGGVKGVDARNLVDEVAAGLDPSERGFPSELARTSDYMTHPVFNTYHSETEMLRYITTLQNKVFISN